MLDIDWWRYSRLLYVMLIWGKTCLLAKYFMPSMLSVHMLVAYMLHAYVIMKWNCISALYTWFVNTTWWLAPNVCLSIAENFLFLVNRYKFLMWTGTILARNFLFLVNRYKILRWTGTTLAENFSFLVNRCKTLRWTGTKKKPYKYMCKNAKVWGNMTNKLQYFVSIPW